MLETHVMMLEDITPEEFEFLDRAAIAFATSSNLNEQETTTNRNRIAVKAYKFAEELLRERRKHNPGT